MDNILSILQSLAGGIFSGMTWFAANPEVIHCVILFSFVFDYLQPLSECVQIIPCESHDLAVTKLASMRDEYELHLRGFFKGNGTGDLVYTTMRALLTRFDQSWVVVDNIITRVTPPQNPMVKVFGGIINSLSAYELAVILEKFTAFPFIQGSPHIATILGGSSNTVTWSGHNAFMSYDYTQNFFRISFAIQMNISIPNIYNYIVTNSEFDPNIKIT